MSRRSLANYQRNHPLLARVERCLHHSVKALIGNSSAVAAQLIQECRNPQKVGIIHNGVELLPLPDLQARAARRRELGISEDAFVIAVIANLIPYKGHADLFAALANARERLRGPWRLILIGRGPRHRPRPATTRRDAWHQPEYSLARRAVRFASFARCGRSWRAALAPGGLFQQPYREDGASPAGHCHSGWR